MRFPNVFFLSFAVFLVQPVVGRAADLTVICDNVRSAAGTMRLELDTTLAAWDNKEKPAATADVKAEPHTMTYTFKGLAPGKYALGIYHDENDNGELDANFLGVPKEGFGFSNNPKIRFRKPTFDEASFQLTEAGATLTVHLNYM